MPLFVQWILVPSETTEEPPMRASIWETRWGPPQVPWLKRDAGLNWIALGLLLAAWNAADDAGPVRRRPQPLQGYSFVTVRAMTRIATAPVER